ncbi:MAG: NTP transferase domain-containing protein, partial [Oscillospiraceae bacterium]|nr:NTP transferase domain-containing protein [Oscillospiraceae bacterium]
MRIEDLIISEDITVLQAMQQLNEKGKKILFIAPELKLKAVLTDGDIRRHILHGGSLDVKVGEMANYNFLSLNVSRRHKASEQLVKQSVTALPILDNEGYIVDVEFFDEISVKVKKELNLPVVIMAGGLGTRLYPYTKILPKPLIPVGEKPIIEHIVDRFRSFGCMDYRMIVNHKKNMIKAYFNELCKDYSVEFVDEEVFLGTGGGLSLLKGKIDTPFFLTNCDVLIEADYNDIYKFHKKNGNLITVVCALKHVTIPYGVFNLNDSGEIESVTEKPTFNFLTNTGMYLVDNRIIEELEENTVIGFPDIMEKYRTKGFKVGVYPVSEDSWMDMGQLEELENMRRRLENK